MSCYLRWRFFFFKHIPALETNQSVILMARGWPSPRWKFTEYKKPMRSCRAKVTSYVAHTPSTAGFSRRFCVLPSPATHRHQADICKSPCGDIACGRKMPAQSGKRPNTDVLIGAIIPRPSNPGVLSPNQVCWKVAHFNNIGGSANCFL